MSSEGAKDRGRLLAAVFLDGEYGDPSWYRDLAARADILLAADGGAAFLAAEDITPQAVVGDFDSLDEAVAGILEDRGVELVRHPVRKDVTDGELAVEEALRRGAGEVVLAGATGALDHTLGHLAILRRLAASGIASRLVAPDLAVTVLVAPAEVVLAAPPGIRVSLAPLGAGATVTLEGFDYPLRRGTLPADACLGLGNHVAVADASIILHAGTVIALVEWGKESFALAGGRPGGV